MVIGVMLAFAILVVIATSTGGSDGQRGDSAAPAVASSEPAQPSEPPDQPTAPAASEAPPTPADSGDTDTGTGDGGFDLEDVTHVTVPDVVGMDLQSAQEGLFPRLRTTSVDATGEDRMQLVDSNWIVVRMDPPAGERVPRFTDVTLYVVKEGESVQS